jgi:hypothetical protein
VQGVHTRVSENSVKPTQGVHLELGFEFKEDQRARWVHQNRIKAQKGKLIEEDTPDLLNTLRKLCKECIEKSQGVCEDSV